MLINLNTFSNEFTDNPHILLGDFNALLLDYGNNPDNNQDNTNRFKELLIQNYLQILNDKKANTCIHKGAGLNYCNDYIIISNPLNNNQFTNFEAHNDSLFTDHIPIIIDLIYNIFIHTENKIQQKYKISRLQDPIDGRNIKILSLELILNSSKLIIIIQKDYIQVQSNIQDNKDPILGSFIRILNIINSLQIQQTSILRQKYQIPCIKKLMYNLEESINKLSIFIKQLQDFEKTSNTTYEDLGKQGQKRFLLLNENAKDMFSQAKKFLILEQKTK